MTHQPPLPDAATSPYPLHPAPIPEEVKARHEAEAAAAAAEAAAPEPAPGVSNTTLGIGAAIAVGTAAAAAGLLYARRRTATARKPGRSGDDKSKRGPADRRRVAAGEPYEVGYFARKHRITAAEARDIIKQAGPDREAANRLAERRKRG